MSSERHPATAPVWEWLESAEGQARPDAQRTRIREVLERLDRDLHGLDESWPMPEKLPEDYWESAQ